MREADDKEILTSEAEACSWPRKAALGPSILTALTFLASSIPSRTRSTQLIIRAIASLAKHLHLEAATMRWRHSNNKAILRDVHVKQS